MKISIVTVTYNCQKLIEKTMLSVLGQSYEDIEYIIIDSKSTDGTLGIVSKYANVDKRINYISEKDEGIYNAMNKSIKYFTGQYVLFLNAGDYLFSDDTLHHMVNKIEQENYPDIINGNTIVYTDSGIEKIERKPFSKKMLWMANTICHQSVLAKAELFQEYTFDEKYRYCADRDWIYFMYLHKKRFAYINEDVVFYEGNGFSSNEKVKSAIIKERYMLQKKYCKERYFVHKLIRKLCMKDVRENCT